MKKYKNGMKIIGVTAIGAIAILFTIGFLGFRQNHRQKGGLPKQFLEDLATEAVMTGPTNDWFYFVPAYKNDSDENGLWRVHKKTQEKEHISEKLYQAILVLGEKVYVQDFAEGLYQMDPDGSNQEIILEGFNSSPKLRYQNGWVYFIVDWYFCRYQIQTGKVERLYKSETPSLTFGFDLVVGGEYLYSRGESEGKYGIRQYNLTTGKSEVCVELAAGREIFVDDAYSKQEMCLTECGNYLVLIYYGEETEKRIEKIYATEKGKRITKETVWKEVRFPDMQKGTALPPHNTVSIFMGNVILEAGTEGYVFHDGYAYYLNKDWNLCARPLFGKRNEVTVYKGTEIWIDPYERVQYFGNTLVFGKDCFYYRYYTAVDEEDLKMGENNAYYEPVPTEWSEYIGELPGV